MKVLVANLGSTSFKYRLFNMADSAELARGSVERIGAAESRCRVWIGSWSDERTMAVPHHGVAVEACLSQLTDVAYGCLAGPGDLSAIGFKAVHGGRYSGVFRVSDAVLEAMEEVASVAPAHNPPYTAAMRQLAQFSGSIPLIAAFETDFHRTIPDGQRLYAIPTEWTEALPIRRWGFHGASHRYIAERAAQLLGNPQARIINCHLGGSSSLCAIRHGQSIATTMGNSPQTGLPQNNRVGDFDPFALPLIMRHTGLSLEAVLAKLAHQSGLAGMSGTSGDWRDLRDAVLAGNHRAKQAMEVYISEIRRQLGGLLVLLGGAEAIVFTGGIGENGADVREAVCQGLEELGICLDAARNEQVRGRESSVHADHSRVQLWCVPTNEEIIVARQCAELLNLESSESIST
jgi:acetate kinase